MSESLWELNNRLDEMLLREAVLSKAVFLFLCGACLYLFAFSLYKGIKRKNWENIYFLVLCGAVFFWGLCSSLAVFASAPERAQTLYFLRDAGIMFVPAFLYLHTRRQVSYKELHVVYIIMICLVPCLILLFNMLPVPVPGSFWLMAPFCLYAGVMLICSYLLCFSVFYQMPRHMRQSTRYILLSISAISLSFFMTMLWQSGFSERVSANAALEILLPLAKPLAFLFLLFPLYIAMKRMPASDVIVTSREFVVGGLATTVLVLNRNRKILDWNRKEWAGYPLPKPLYREFVEVYRERMLEEHDFRVSPHSEDIVTASDGNQERHFLMHTRAAETPRKRFGYIMEISEITPIYKLLRYFEGIAHFDQLTRVYNRNAYLERVEQYLRKEYMPLLILVGDVNKLKPINDNYGHLQGDALLSMVAEILRKAAPPEAFVARVGGDEFVLLVPGGDLDVAVRFVQEVNILCSLSKNEVFGSPGISWGYAVMTSEEQSYNEVFSKADSMMYEIKKRQFQSHSSGLLPQILKMGNRRAR